MSQQPADFDDRGNLDVLDERLISEYLRNAIPVDALAYSETFDRMYEKLRQAGEQRSKGDTYRRLLTLRKSGRLPQLGRVPDQSSRSLSA